MHAASRNALTNGEAHVDKLVAEAPETVAVASQIGSELFSVVERLDEERSLRENLADASLSEEQRTGIARQVFEGQVAAHTLDVLTFVAGQKWSTSREFRQGLVLLARRALLRAAESQGQLEAVEHELSQLSALLERESRLTQLLGDRAADAAARRGLLANVLYGKVSVFAEALALQVIGRPENNPVDDLAALSRQAAELRGRDVALVTSATELSDEQRNTLAQKLEQIYSRPISIHAEVDPNLLGGLIVRVGYHVIDGSTRGKIARARSALSNV